MLFIHHQYERSSRELAVRPDFVAQPPAREERVIVPGARASTGPSSRRSTSGARSRTTSGRSSSSRTPKPWTRVRADWERQVPGVPLVVIESPYRALAGPADRLSRRPRPGLAGRQAIPDHVRRHPRVRRQELVGAAPVQPVGPAPSNHPARDGPTRSWSTSPTGARIREAFEPHRPSRPPATQTDRQADPGCRTAARPPAAPGGAPEHRLRARGEA